ncbi:thiamine phosphate synthase [Pseudohongiella sp.]|uniref:thiamine phosphate synthase n=1 Tax=marine sediment metagenome TaxID=412755 RepID=A0A0F9YQM7_9ZZZZ|nr:thiamine phosphate synthase [Pseudohongiella sp.]HDZ10267.1 thiamine phosphate synthase [Pseudohongiella sp.]HEA64247.1 thiamine phosphate synthase [Pseudohongiella sp.]
MSVHLAATSVFPASGVYAITDEHLLTDVTLLTCVEQALSGGVRVLQYRRKNGEFRDRVLQAAALRTLCRRYHACLIINDDIDLCQAIEADGVHLGQSDTALAEARYRLGPQAIIGISCHDEPALAAVAEQQGASYIALGRFFPSLTKPDAPAASIGNLRLIRAQTSLPIVAIGGITADNGRSLIDAGADLLAVINYLFAAPDIKSRAHALSDLF